MYNLLKIFWKKVGILIVLTPIFYLDGLSFQTIFPYGQHLLTFLAAIAFIVFYKRSRRRVRRIFVYVLIVGPLVEYSMSLGLGMYTYRLHNIPLYVFLMHAIGIGRLFEFSRYVSTTQYTKTSLNFLYGFIIIHSIISLLFFNDVFGFVMTLGVILILVIRPKYRVFFLTWHFVITFTEISGVYFGAWTWPPIAFDFFEFLPSHSPPSGISLFYFMLELGTFIMYILLHNNVWVRYKRIKNYKLSKAL